MAIGRRITVAVASSRANFRMHVPDGRASRALRNMSGTVRAPEGPRSLSLRAVFAPAGDGWIHARLLALPGVITCAPTETQARAMLIDALREYLLACDAEADESAASERLTLTIE